VACMIFHNALGRRSPSKERGDGIWASQEDGGGTAAFWEERQKNRRPFLDYMGEEVKKMV